MSKLESCSSLVALTWFALVAPTLFVNGDLLEYDNRTARYTIPTFHEGFEFSTRIPKKPFAKKNNFLSFETKNQNIEVGFEFSVPFLSVPVKRSVDTVRNTAQSVMTPLANINAGAVFLAGVMVVAGVLTAYLFRTFVYMDDPIRGGFSPFARTKKDLNDHHINKILDMLDDMLRRYDINAKACTQRLVCSTVQEAAFNVANGSGSSADKLLDGISGSSWILHWVNGSALESALRDARTVNQQCDRRYSKCALNGDVFELFMDQMLNYIDNRYSTTR